jgi:hypothetical protein
MISGRQAAPYPSCLLCSHQCGGLCEVEVSLIFVENGTGWETGQTNRMQLYNIRWRKWIQNQCLMETELTHPVVT